MELWLYVGLVALLLVPIWSVPYVPTIDGPTHVYNAWIHKNLLSPSQYPNLGEYFEVDWRPIPNWLSHAVLTLLLFVAEPRYAEKLLLSGHIGLFAAAACYLTASVGPHRLRYAFLALPLIYNQLLLLGFYNFSLSVSFFMLAVGYWWRERLRWSSSFALRISGLLVLCWFTHIVSFVMVVLACAVLSATVMLARRRMAPELVRLTVLLPWGALPLWFVGATDGQTIPAAWSLGQLCRYLLRLEVLYLFGEEQRWLGVGLALVFGAVLVLTVVSRRPTRVVEEDGFLLLSLVLIVVYALCPEGLSGGNLLKNRASIFPFLVLLPWFAPRMGALARHLTVAIPAILTGIQVVLLVLWYRGMQPDIHDFLAATEPIARSSRVTPLLFSRDTSQPVFGALGHLFDRAAVDKGLIDWDNYQADSGHFPIRFREGLNRPGIYAIEAHPDKADVGRFRSTTDYVFTWKLPSGSEAEDRILRFYEPVPPDGEQAEGSGSGRVFARKP